ncbi:molybdopterin-binding protein [Starkeya sp. ORNL1]|uniref:molybdopterin-binding protein n=1 Tax=Starkeya sp. ORNL1 TaxID=2709380 RepID=UPI00146454F1|nr:molybdopterin-binding protein [Starkeya sp. ORNL1]QJP16849.1 molybdopterin-binding protein [Starkeya sp. ORNL1]
MTQRLPLSLTSLDVARQMLCGGLQPVAPRDVLLADALGCVAAEMAATEPFPPRDIATLDGWAFAARDLVGASSYAPLAMAAAPCWVEAGDAMPQDCDCVVDADVVDAFGPLVQVTAEAIPGQGVRRAGSDIAGGGALVAAGHPIRSLDLVRARGAGYTSISVRRPSLRLIDMPTTKKRDLTVHLIAELAQAAGTMVTRGDTASLRGDASDLLITIGGTGVGRGDATVLALAQSGVVLAHGIALQPGRTTAIGINENIPVIALPGAPDQALAAWWTLALPMVDHLALRVSRPMVTLPLARKIASGVGVAEIALLRQTNATWMPLAVGDLSLDAIASADAWCAIPAGSEGFAAGAVVDAYLLKSCD